MNLTVVGAQSMCTFNFAIKMVAIVFNFQLFRAPICQAIRIPHAAAEGDAVEGRKKSIENVGRPTLAEVFKSSWVFGPAKTFSLAQQARECRGNEGIQVFCQF
jgi:hypothetical protein